MGCRQSHWHWPIWTRLQKSYDVATFVQGGTNYAIIAFTAWDLWNFCEVIDLSNPANPLAGRSNPPHTLALPSPPDCASVMGPRTSAAGGGIIFLEQPYLHDKGQPIQPKTAEQASKKVQNYIPVARKASGHPAGSASSAEVPSASISILTPTTSMEEAATRGAADQLAT